MFEYSVERCLHVIGYDNEKSVYLKKQQNWLLYKHIYSKWHFYRLDIILRENWHRLLQTYITTMNMYLITLGKAVFLTTKNYNRLA